MCGCPKYRDVSDMVKTAMSESQKLLEWTDLFAMLNGFAGNISHLEAAETYLRLVEKLHLDCHLKRLINKVTVNLAQGIVGGKWVAIHKTNFGWF
jgi:hypothetical protein